MTAFTLEDGMFPNPHFDIQVAGRSAVAARLALAVQANAVAGIDPGGYGDGQGLFLAHPALTVAGIAGVADDLASALAARAGLLDGENRLLHAHLALTVAGIAGLGCSALGGARTLAGLALGQGGNLDLGVGAEHGLFEIELQLVAQIGPAKYLRPAALSAGEDVAEHFTEDVAECLAGAEAAAAAAFEAGMSELIVDRPLLRVAQNLVGLLGLLEFMFRFRILRIAVRMKFHGEAAIRLFDIRLRRGSGHIEELVIILLRHCSPYGGRP